MVKHFGLRCERECCLRGRTKEEPKHKRSEQILTFLRGAKGRVPC